MVFRIHRGVQGRACLTTFLIALIALSATIALAQVSPTRYVPGEVLVGVRAESDNDLSRYAKVLSQGLVIHGTLGLR
jgi:hypothetical protein